MQQHGVAIPSVLYVHLDDFQSSLLREPDSGEGVLGVASAVAEHWVDDKEVGEVVDALFRFVRDTESAEDSVEKRERGGEKNEGG